jgi:hypothetical protein
MISDKDMALYEILRNACKVNKEAVRIKFMEDPILNLLVIFSTQYLREPYINGKQIKIEKKEKPEEQKEIMRALRREVFEEYNLLARANISNY